MRKQERGIMGRYERRKKGNREYVRYRVKQMSDRVVVSERKHDEEREIGTEGRSKRREADNMLTHFADTTPRS